MSRLFVEQYSGSIPLDDELKSKLGLTSTVGRQYRTLTAQSSFMRPMCQHFVSYGDLNSTADFPC